MAKKRRSTTSTCLLTWSRSVWSSTDDKGSCITGAWKNRNYEPSSLVWYAVCGLDKLPGSAVFSQGLPDSDHIPALGSPFRLRLPSNRFGETPSIASLKPNVRDGRACLDLLETLFQTSAAGLAEEISNRKIQVFKLPMHRIVKILILLFASFLPELASAKPGSVQLHYTVDVSQPAKQFLKIRAEIEGLPEGFTTITFPGSRHRISHVGWQSEDGEVSALTLEEGQFVVDGSSPEPVTLVFQLRGETLHRLDRSTYLDQDRCLFHPQDVLLQVENQDPRVTLSFVLPDDWKVVNPVHPAKDGSFSIEAKKMATPFYLGFAESSHDDSNGLVWMAIEPGWPSPPELLSLLRQQIRHRERFVRNPGTRPLLAAFLTPSGSGTNNKLVAHGGPQLLALQGVPGLTETSLATRMVQQAMALGLARTYFPALANFSPALGPHRLIDYLALKACLKTGVLGRAEFLDALASDLWATFGESPQTPARPHPNSKTNRAAAPPAPRIRCNGLLLDLALTFFGEANPSLDAFLSSGFGGSAAEPISEADVRKRLRQEPQVAAALTGIWQAEDPQKIGELLRPFGLLFDRQELPAFDFLLNETFQIAHLARHTQATTEMLELGDRILAINNHRLVLPDDLLKCRSRLMPGQEIQLDIERRNLPLRLTQRVAKEVMLKLEINKLADADKQQKLEQFLSADLEEN